MAANPMKNAINRFARQGRRSIDEALWNDTVASNKAAQWGQDYMDRNPLDAYGAAAKQARKVAQNTQRLKVPKAVKRQGGQDARQFHLGQRSATKQLRAQNLAHANLLGALARNERAEQQARKSNLEQFRRFNALQLGEAASAARLAQQRAVSEARLGLAAQQAMTPSTLPGVGGNAVPGAGSGQFGSDYDRALAISERRVPPELVDSGHGWQLDRAAMASLQRIAAKIGYMPQPASKYDAYRPAAVQAANQKPGHAGPDESEHVVGLAFDVHASMVNNPELIRALEEEGWVRYDPQGEPWHWSYLVRG